MSLIKILKDTAKLVTSRNIEVRLGNMEEHNFGLEKIVKQNALPVLFIIPFEVRDVSSSGGLIYSSFPFNAFMLDKQVGKITNEYDSEEVEEQIIEPMRLLARQYMYQLQKDIRFRDDKGNGPKEIIYTPTYAVFDDHVHGVNIRCTMPVVEGLTGCH